MQSEMLSESEFLRHEPCPSCGSSDALARYTDGHAHCFSCQHYEHGEGSTTTNHHKQNKLMDFTGDFIPLKSRNLREDTLKKFNVRYDHDTKTIRFPYYSQAGQLVGFKSRDADKDFRWTGKNEDHTLFGQQLWGTGKELVITEGEIDCLSLYQLRPSWPVVSLPNGAAAAKKALQHQLKWVMGFDNIVLFFDSDEAGQQAAQDCASLFPHDRLFIARLDSYKDANEALIAKDYEAITSTVLWNKKPYSPKTVIDGRDLFTLATKPLHGRDADWPYAGLNNLTSGLRRGELVTITAGSGVGKSTFCGEVAQCLVDQGEKVGYIALEESLQRTALRLMTVRANRPLHLDNSGDIKEAFDASLGTGRVFLREGFGSIDPDEILSDCRYLVKGLDCHWLSLDHLSILLSGNEADERRLIDITMTKLRQFTEETNCGMILISHLKRPSMGKGHEQGAKVGLGQLRGSHAIAQLSDGVIALERDLDAPQGVTNVRVLKNRFTGDTGDAGALLYDPLTGRQKTTDASDLLQSTTSTTEDPF